MNPKHMDEQEFIKKRDALVDEIRTEYLYDKWIALTGDRHLTDRPEKMTELHYLFGCLYSTLPQTPEERIAAIQELEQLLCSLKSEYENFAKR